MHAGISALTFPDRTVLTTVSSEISRFPLMKLTHMPQVSDSGEPNEHSHIAPIHAAFPIAYKVGTPER